MAAGSPPSAATRSRAMVRPSGLRSSMNGGDLGDEAPGEGVGDHGDDGAAPAAGQPSGGPPSWKISSTTRRRLRTRGSGTGPSLVARQPRPTRRRSARPSLNSGGQGRAPAGKAEGGHAATTVSPCRCIAAPTIRPRPISFSAQASPAAKAAALSRCGERLDLPRHQAVAEVAVGLERRAPAGA